MAGRWVRFNPYLLLTLAVLATAALGCQTGAKRKELATLRLHLEVNPDGTDRNAPAAIGRAAPFYVNAETQPFLDETSVTQAWVVEGLGGFQLLVQFDRRGTWLLDQYSTVNKGKRVAIYSEFGQSRWLAAPVLANRITDGTLVFTPDATREEAERIVRGLLQVAKQVQKGRR
jgi:hypothetical protein